MILGSVDPVPLNKPISCNVAGADLKVFEVSFIARRVATFAEYEKQCKELEVIRTMIPANAYFYECEILD